MRQFSWFQHPGGYYHQQILDFKAHRYLELYTLEELAESERLLDQVVELANNKPRAKFFRQAFLMNNFDLHDGVGRWKGEAATADFFREPDKGRNNSAAVGILQQQGNQCPRYTSLCYLAYPPTKSEDQFFKVTIWYKAENFSSEAEVSFAVTWQTSETSDPYSKKISWAPTIYNSSPVPFKPVDSKWQEFTIYAHKPALPNVKMVVQFGVIKFHYGQLLFDDLTVQSTTATQ